MQPEGRTRRHPGGPLISAGVVAAVVLGITVAVQGSFGAAEPAGAATSVVAATVTATSPSTAHLSTPPRTGVPATTARVAPTTAAQPSAAAPRTPAPSATAAPTTRAAAASARPANVEELITDRPMHTLEDVNLRSAAGTDGTSVVTVLVGGRDLTAGETVDGWVPVRAGDKVGWVSADFVADGAAPAAPAAPSAPAPSQPRAEADRPAAPAAAPASTGNWMTDLIPQVDPGGAANWVLERNGGWGATDGHTVYLDPNMPAENRFSVMVHEYGHILQVQAYGSLEGSAAALSAIVGDDPSSISANESTADCMALMQGATWVGYGCDDALRGAAATLLAGGRP